MKQSGKHHFVMDLCKMCFCTVCITFNTYSSKLEDRCRWHLQKEHTIMSRQWSTLSFFWLNLQSYHKMNKCGVILFRFLFTAKRSRQLVMFWKEDHFQPNWPISLVFRKVFAMDKNNYPQQTASHIITYNKNHKPINSVSVS